MYKFKPILKSTLWGGDRIIPFKAIPIDVDHDVDINQIGESWELSGVEGYEIAREANRQSSLPALWQP